MRTKLLCLKIVIDDIFLFVTLFVTLFLSLSLFLSISLSLSFSLSLFLSLSLSLSFSHSLRANKLVDAVCVLFISNPSRIFVAKKVEVRIVKLQNNHKVFLKRFLKFFFVRSASSVFRYSREPIPGSSSSSSGGSSGGSSDGSSGSSSGSSSSK